MDAPRKLPGFCRDERGVALTEFSIAIPVILFFFLAMLQYSEILQTAQLGDYAAYIAARTYAVRAKAATKPDSYEPDTAARNAAAMALAPVARLTTGGSGPTSWILAPLKALFGSTKAGQLAYGFSVAEFYLQPSAAFKPSVVDVGSHLHSVVAINYPQEINVPGLAGLWDLLAQRGPKPSLLTDPTAYAVGFATHSSATGMQAGLHGLGTNESFALEVASGLPYVNIACNAQTGCEAWSGTLKKAVDNPDPFSN